MKKRSYRPQHSSESGQMLLLGALILLLLLITMPALIFFNRYAASHGGMSQKRLKGKAIAEEGIAFAIRQLESNGSVSWPTPNPCPANFNGTSNNPTRFPSGSGRAYSISCTPGQPQSYQVTLVATPWDTTLSPPRKIAGSSIKAFVSRRTVGAKFPTGLAVSAAVAITKGRNFTIDADGNTGGNIRVFFGPMMCWDASTDPLNAWTLDPYSSNTDTLNPNPSRMPRKYSAGRIGPHIPVNTHPTVTTDGKEYWAFTDIGFENAIDLNVYKTKALNSDLSLLGDLHPTNSINSGATICSIGQDGTRASFHPPCGAMVFGSSAQDYKVAPTHNGYVFYIDGDANFDRMALDLLQGAVIVKGNLTVRVPTPAITGPGISPTPNIRVPPDAYLDFPYDNQPPWPPNPLWPCYTNQNTYNCSGSDANFHFPGAGRGLDYRGFLYVAGDMLVDDDFAMSGVLRVDGYLKVKQGKTLTVIYDDKINRNIQVNPFQLQIDSSIDVP